MNSDTFACMDGEMTFGLFIIHLGNNVREQKLIYYLLIRSLHTSDLAVDPRRFSTCVLFISL